MLAISGLGVVFLAGVSMRFFISGIALAVAAVPVVWNYLFEYQKERVLVFLDPERDPLGAGYHIIQSKIGIGSGGFFGKGWLKAHRASLNSCLNVTRISFLPFMPKSWVLSVRFY